MKVFPLKQGDTKTLSVRLKRNSGALSVAPQSATLIIYLGDGTSIERTLVPGASASVFTYKFTKADVALLLTYLPSGKASVDFDCEVAVVWGTDDGETSPTEGVNVIRLFRALPRA